MRHLYPYGGGQSVAHRSQPARRHPAVRFVELVVLRRPHLVLTDLGRDVTVAVLGRFIQPFDRVLRFDDFARLLVV